MLLQRAERIPGGVFLVSKRRWDLIHRWKIGFGWENEDFIQNKEVTEVRLAQKQVDG